MGVGKKKKKADDVHCVWLQTSSKISQMKLLRHTKVQSQKTVISDFKISNSMWG